MTDISLVCSLLNVSFFNMHNLDKIMIHYQMAGFKSKKAGIDKIEKEYYLIYIII